jgi:hypothetical protein
MVVSSINYYKNISTPRHPTWFPYYRSTAFPTQIFRDLLYWERLKASTRHLKGMYYSETVKVEVFYDCTKNFGGYLSIRRFS